MWGSLWAESDTGTDWIPESHSSPRLSHRYTHTHGKRCGYSATKTLHSESAVTTASPADSRRFSWQGSVYGNRHTRSSNVNNRESDGFTYGFVSQSVRQSVKLMKGKKKKYRLASSSSSKKSQSAAGKHSWNGRTDSQRLETLSTTPTALFLAFHIVNWLF